MSISMIKFALSQNVNVLRETMKKTKSLSSVELPDNLVDLMYETMTVSEGKTVHLVSVRDTLCSAIPLPFMPDCIDYKIGKGCCDEIVKCDGLFVPCSKQCDDEKCAKHIKTRSGFGNYWDRHAAWSNKEPYCVVIKEKEVKEKPYGTYLHGKNLDSSQVNEALAKCGVSLQLDPTLFRAPPKPLKTSRGRKAEKKVVSTDTDDEGEDSDKSEESVSEKSGSEGEKSEEEAEKPKKKALPRWQPEDGEVSEDENSEDESEKPKGKAKKPKAPKEPKAPKTPKAPKAPKEPKAPKAPTKKPKEPEPEVAEPEVTEVPEPEVTEVPVPEPEVAEVAEPEVTEVAEPEVTEVAEPEVTEVADSDPEVVSESDPKSESEPEVPESEPESPESDDENETLSEMAKSMQPPDEGLSLLSKAKSDKKKEKKEKEKAEKKEKEKAEKAEKKAKEKAEKKAAGELKKEAMEKPKKGI